MKYCFIQKIFNNQIIIVLMVFVISVTSSVISEENIYIKDLEVRPVVYNKRSLQLLISWSTLNSTGVTYDVLIRPLAMRSNNTCSERPCSVYSQNQTSILLPKNPIAYVDEECTIQPMCEYSIKVSTFNRNFFVNKDLTIPECVESICSCHHRELLPSISIDGRILSKNQINVTWSIHGKNPLPENVTVDRLHLELREQTSTTYIYMAVDNVTIGELNLIEDIIHTELWNLSKNLMPGGTYMLKGHLEDNRGCGKKDVSVILRYPVLENDANKFQDNEKSSNLHTFLIGMVLITIGCSVIVFYKRFKRCQKRKKNLQNWRGVYHNVQVSGPTRIQMQENFIYVDNDILEARAKGEADYLEVPHSCLTIGREIGKGAFGRVFIARCDKIRSKPGPQIVAIKQLKKRPTTDELEEFLGEIATMKKVGDHPNIVSLLGCCTIKQPLIMIMEYVGCGDLLQYLRKVRAKHEMRCVFDSSKLILHSESSTSKYSNNSGPHLLGGKYVDVIHTSSSNSDASYITQPDSIPSVLRPSVTETLYTILDQDKDSIKTANSIEYVLDHNELKFFAIQIARACKHLEEKQITHRDLAARNILIDEHKVLKISDFGLSRSGIYVNTRNKKVPLRWLSIEAIRDHLYSNRSDVWAFAIVLWEIATLGGFPYPTLSNHELLAYLQAGNRLEKPENCSTILYDLMLKCWANNPEDRPTFADICSKLEPRKERIYIDFNELGPKYVLPPTADDVIQNGIR